MVQKTIMNPTSWGPYQREYVFSSDLSLSLGSRTLLMGILNVTPDSFSDGGQHNDPENALHKAKMMIAAGADIIDIGGESTRPGASYVTEQEEMERVLPVLDQFREHRLQAPISIDTYKAKVADAALQRGAHIINDVWGFKKDPDMASVAAQYQCPVILMHNRSEAVYDDVLQEMQHDLLESVDIAIKAGVKQENIWLDPGIGFGKTYAHNLLVMRNLNKIVALGFPVLLGTSRKSFIRQTLEGEADQVIEGTAVTVSLGIAQGCQVMRVHDVAEIAKTIRMTDTILECRNE